MPLSPHLARGLYLSLQGVSDNRIIILLSRIPQGPGSRDEGEDWHGLEWTEALPYTVQGA